MKHPSGKSDVDRGQERTVTVRMPPEPIPATPRAMRIVSILGATAHAVVPTERSTNARTLT